MPYVNIIHRDHTYTDVGSLHSAEQTVLYRERGHRIVRSKPYYEGSYEVARTIVFDNGETYYLEVRLD